MPSRFSAAFRRKSATNPEDFQVQPSSTESSFRVLERNQPQEARTFDGGVKMARIPAHMMHKANNSESEVEDNMFAGLNTYRGSGGSNTTKATSTDTSSRHSNASTAPSSADIAHPADEPRQAKRAMTSYEPPQSRQSQKTGGSFLDRAGRTFSFGMQKKSQSSPAKGDEAPDVPPLPMLQREDEYGRTRAMTASTTSTTTTATPPRLEEKSGLDLGGDFGSMFSSFDKRASQITLRNEQQRQGQPIPLKLGSTGLVDAEPSPRSWTSNKSSDGLMATSKTSPSLVPRHQPSFEYRTSTSPTGVVEDEDARLLADSVAATKFLTQPKASGKGGPYGRDDDFATDLRKPIAADENEDNLFAGTPARFSRPAQKPTRPASPPRGSKVMTTAEFERYEKEKNRQHLERTVYGRSAEDEDDDEDEINYDDEEDAEEKAKEAAKRSRNKQAQMQAYRQKNMKTTGGDNGSVSPLTSSRPTFRASMSAPHLGLAKTPSPELARPASEEDEDDEVPLAILQAHGFPSKARNSSRLSMAGSNPNLRVTSQAHSLRPPSVVGEQSPLTAKRASTLPAFARGLPQDPFAGAGGARPAVRESLSFAGGSPNPDRLAPQPPQHQPVHPGGLVGVIASEERARAMRRGSPNMESQRMAGGAGGQTLDPLTGIPPHMMYGSGQQNMNRMSQQPLSVADQAQVQMTQQMTQFMQMQMQFMQMMAGNQQPGGQAPQMPMPFGMPQMAMMQQQQQQQQQQPYGMLGATQSVADFSSGQSIYGQQPMMPRRMDAGSRTMSMVQPNTGSQMLHGGMGGPAFGYTPSIAPSERSTVGLPGRYRPVSHVPPQLDVPILRPSSVSGALSMTPTDHSKSKSTSTIKLITKTRNNTGSDDDDEEGWESMRAKRDQKKSRWRLRKDNAD